MSNPVNCISSVSPRTPYTHPAHQFIINLENVELETFTKDIHLHSLHTNECVCVLRYVKDTSVVSLYVCVCVRKARWFIKKKLSSKVRREVFGKIFDSSFMIMILFKYIQAHLFQSLLKLSEFKYCVGINP